MSVHVQTIRWRSINPKITTKL